MRYRYRILMDGNGQFLVTRDLRLRWFMRWLPDEAVYAVRTRHGLEWEYGATRFDDIRAAIEALQALQAEDQRARNAWELTTVHED